jgi:mRNA interferase MazF
MVRRPALVISVAAFNQATGMALCCPVTNTDRRSPFHLALPAESGLTGFVMCEQVKSIDFQARRIKYVAKAPRGLVEDVLAILDAVLYPRS